MLMRGRVVVAALFVGIAVAGAGLPAAAADPAQVLEPASTAASPRSALVTPTVDVQISVDDGRPARRVSMPDRLTTAGANELFVAYIGADGPRAPRQLVQQVGGGGSTWTLAARANSTWGTTEVWSTYITSPFSAVVSAELAIAFDASMTVVAYDNAAQAVGAIGSASGTTGRPKATVTPHSADSLIWASGHDWSNAIAPAAVDGQAIMHSFLDARAGDSYWVQSSSVPVAAGTPVTIADTMPIGDR
jgi:hypothetical protein